MNGDQVPAEDAAAAETAAAALTRAARGQTMKALRGQSIEIRTVSYSPTKGQLGAFHLDVTVSDPHGPRSERHLLEVELDHDTLESLDDPAAVHAMAFTYLAIAMEWWDLEDTERHPAGIRAVRHEGGH